MGSESIKIDVSLKQQSLQAFQELNRLMEKAEANAKELKNATIALAKAREKGGRGSAAQINRVNRATAKSVELVTLLTNKQVQLDAVNKRLNATRKKTIGLMRTMSTVAGKLVGIYAVLLGTFRAIGKLKNTLVTLDGFNFAMEKITGSAREAADAFNFVTKVSEQFGTSLETTAERYVKFSTAARQAGLGLTATQSIFRSMSKASGVLGLKTDEVKGVFLALEQMLSKGKVTTEELRRQLGERLPGAMGMMVTAYNRLHPKQQVTLDQFDALLKKGKVLSHEVLPEFAKVVEETLGITMVNSVDTLQASITRADTAFTIMVRDMEEGTGAMSTVFKAFYDTLASIWKDIGELFLTADEQRQKYYTKGLAQGRLYLKELNEIEFGGFKDEDARNVEVGDKLSKDLNALLMKYREIKRRIEDGPIFIEIKEKDPFGIDVTRSQEVPGSGSLPGDAALMDFYAEEIGKVKGALIAMGHAADENIPKVDPDETPGKKPFYLQEIDPGSIDGLKQAIKLTKELRDAAILNQGEFGDLDNMLEVWQAELDYLEGKIEYEEYLNVIYEAREKALNQGDSDEEPFDTFTRAFTGLIEQNAPPGEGFTSMVPIWIEEYKTMYGEDLTNFEKFLKKKLKLHQETLKAQGEVDQQILDEEALARQLVLDKAIEVGNQLFEIGSALFDRKIENINAEIIAEEEKYDRMYDLAEGDKDHQKDILIQKRAAVAKLEAEELKLRQKQAKLHKLQAIANAIINTSLAVTSALTAGPGVGIALAALTAALGAAQIATIIAQPIPQYAQGRIGGREELAIVGDGGRREVIESNGQAYLTPNVPTLAYLQRGDSVHKNENVYRDSVLNSIMNNVNNSFELGKIEDAIEKGFKKATINNYMKMPSVKVDLNHELWLISNSQFGA